MRRFFSFLVAASVIATAPAEAAEPLAIRHGWVSMVNTLSPVVFQKPAILSHYGASYTVEPIHFSGTTLELQALAAGELDIVTFGNSTVASAVLNAHMTDLRIIADGFQDGVEGYYSTEYTVRKDDPIASIDDLKGKVMVTNALGGSVDVPLRAMLRRHLLEDHRDVTLREAENSAMVPMLREKRVDLAGLVPPFVFDPWLKDNSKVLFRMRDAIGPSQMVVLVARAGFLEKNRAAVVDFFEDMLRGIKWYQDPANRQAVLAIIAQATKAPAETFAPYLYTGRDYYRDKLARPNLAALQHDIDTQVQMGFFKASFDVATYADLSFIEAAAKRLP